MTKEDAIKILGGDNLFRVENPTEREKAMACLAYWEGRESCAKDFESCPEWKLGKAIIENLPVKE